MIKTAEYIQFEEGFLKVAEQEGCNVNFLRGFIKEADEIVEKWALAFDMLEKEYNDPQYKTKVACELIRMTMISPAILKKAEEAPPAQTTEPTGIAGLLSGFTKGTGWQNSLEQGLGGQGAPGFLGSIVKYLHENPDTLSGVIGGGGTGGLIGLLIGALLGHPLVGLMLGGLGGAGLGTFMTHNQLQGNLHDSANKGQGETVPAGAPQSTTAPSAETKPVSDRSLVTPQPPAVVPLVTSSVPVIQPVSNAAAAAKAPITK
jgi:hypothetical protein